MLCLPGAEPSLTRVRSQWPRRRRGGGGARAGRNGHLCCPIMQMDSARGVTGNCGPVHRKGIDRKRPGACTLPFRVDRRLPAANRRFFFDHEGASLNGTVRDSFSFRSSYRRMHRLRLRLDSLPSAIQRLRVVFLVRIVSDSLLRTIILLNRLQ